MNSTGIGSLVGRIASGLASVVTAIAEVSQYVAARVDRADGDAGPLQTTKEGALLVRGNEPRKSVTVVKNDATAVSFPHGLWVGTGGNITGRLKDDTTSQVWKNIPSGSWVPGWFVRVDTATTAADILGYEE